MITFQDFKNIKNDAEILDLINEYKFSNEYAIMAEAEKYYFGENTEILNRLQWFFNSKGQQEVDKFKANNQIPCNYYKKITKQEVQYLLGNGVTMDNDIKKQIGKNFDLLLQKAGLNARIHGVTYIYCYINQENKFMTNNFKATELLPLFDEFNGELRAAIRFYQIDVSKPMIIEVYTEEGKTVYINNDKDIKLLEPLKPYKLKVKRDIMGEEVQQENWSTLPIIAYWGDETHKTTFTPSLKNKIDLYDIIMSDFGNNLEDNNDIYWVLKNYQGQGMSEFLADYKYFKTVRTDDDGEATMKTFDTPYEARETALNLIRTQIYEDTMALDIKALTGGSLTNVAINSAKTDLDLKVDEFEWQTVEMIDKILSLFNEYKKVELKEDIKFIRRTLTNDTEIIENIYKMRSDIDLKTALKLNPYIDDKEIENIITELDKQDEIVYNKLKS